MQIHELNTFAGTPGSSNFLPIDNGSDTGKISGEALLKGPNDRIDNLVANVLPDSVETLAASSSGIIGTYTLSKSVNSFNFLDFYFKSVRGIHLGGIRIPVSHLPATITVPYVEPGEKTVYDQEFSISASGATLTVRGRLWEWAGTTSDNAYVQSGTFIAELVRVDGIKISSNTNAELADLRIGANGITYISAGAAVRGQVEEIYDYIGLERSSVLNYSTEGATSPLTGTYQWLIVDTKIPAGKSLKTIKVKTNQADGTSITATFRLFSVSGNLATAYDEETVTATAAGGFVVFNMSLTTSGAETILGIESDTEFARVFSSSGKVKFIAKEATSTYINSGLDSYSIYLEAIAIETELSKIPILEEEVDKLNSDWQEVIAPEEESIFSFTSNVSSAAGAGYSWIIRNLVIPAGTYISTITFKTSATAASPLKINLWSTADNANYTKYRELSLTPVIDNGYAILDFNDTVDRDSLIGIISDSNIARVDSTSTRELWYVSDDATTFNISSVSSVAYQFLVDIKEKTNAVKKLEQEVAGLSGDLSALEAEIHVGPGLQYEEIQDALDALTTNYATIIVHPKDTPYSRFSLMRRLGGTYPWGGLSTVKHISIIGVDKSKCVIQDDSGNYNTPPAEIATNGIIKNLRFIATHDDSDGTETTGSYAVHVDNRPADANGMKLIFENCDFISYQMSAVGLGLYRNQDILFDSCNFESYTDPTWKPNESYDSAYFCELGAYFMHTTMGRAGGNMFIRFRNCFLYHEGGDYVMRIEDADDPRTAYLEAIDNTLWNGTRGNTGYKPSDIMQKPYNHGNNATELNQ